MAFEILRRKKISDGMALFRGNLHPRLEELTLERYGISVRKRAAPQNVHWIADLEHPQWGKATLVAPREDLRPPTFFYEYDTRLTSDEKAIHRQVGCALHVVVEARRSYVLADRKNLLRYLSAVLGQDGVLAFDRTSIRFWTRSSLDEELAHDADLDVDAIMTFHNVEMTEGSQWLHSHGLAEIGAKDFDILQPHMDVQSLSGYDLLRAIAFAILEGTAQDGVHYVLAHPGGEVKFVDVETFNRRASPKELALRDTDDGSHNEKRLIVCEPARGILARWTKRLEPSRFLSSSISDNIVMTFSTAATNLMAERAGKTYGVFRGLFEEFRDLDLPMLVKMGYEMDGGSEFDREHLWFTVNACEDDAVDATLVNEPNDIARMRKGTRGLHSLDRLTDWMILSPVGSIHPRSMSLAATLRENRDEMLEALRSST